MNDDRNKPVVLDSREVFGSALISLESVPTRKRSKDLSPLASFFPRLGSTEVLLKLDGKIQSRLIEISGVETTSDGKSAEEGMLRQVLQWLNRGEEDFPDSNVEPFRPFTTDEFIGIYELARLYYEMGFLTASERILNGLVLCDEGATPSRGALGLVNLETGKADEAVSQFRASVKSPRRIDDVPVGKLGLIAAFLSVGDIERAGTLVSESESDLNQLVNEGRNSGVIVPRSDELQELWHAFALRCGVVKG